MKRFVLCVVLIGLASASHAALAQELRQFENYSVHLGAVDGSVYTTQTPAGSPWWTTSQAGQGRSAGRS